MRKKKAVLALAGSLLAIALVAVVASATVFAPGKIYGGTFTGTQSGTVEFTVPNTAHTSTLFYRCNSVSFTGKVQPTSPQAAVTFAPSFTSCTTQIGPPRGAIITSPTAWTLTPTSYNDASGTSAESISMPNADVVIRPVGLTCNLTLKAQTVSSGISGQDVDGGGANTTHPFAAGLNLQLSGMPTGYTSNCAGISPNDTGTWSGAVKLVGAWAGP